MFVMHAWMADNVPYPSASASMTLADRHAHDCKTGNRRTIDGMSVQAMTGSTSLIDEITSKLTTGILKKLNEEQAHCLTTG